MMHCNSQDRGRNCFEIIISLTYIILGFQCSSFDKLRTSFVIQHGIWLPEILKNHKFNWKYMQFHKVSVRESSANVFHGFSSHSGSPIKDLTRFDNLNEISLKSITRVHPQRHFFIIIIYTILGYQFGWVDELKTSLSTKHRMLLPGLVNNNKFHGKHTQCDKVSS